MTTSPAHDAWQTFLGDLARAGEVVMGPLGATSERERAEGFRHITRVASIAVEMFVEKGDRARPGLTRWMKDGRKVFGDNPETIYDAALVDPAITYRLSGTRGTTTYLGVCLYATDADTGARRIAGNVDDVEMPIAQDGSFTLCIGPARPEDADDTVAFLQTAPDVTDLMVRQYVHRQDQQQQATLTLAPWIDAGPPPPLDEATIAARLREAGAWVADTVEIEATLSALVTSMTPGLLRAGQQFVDQDGAPAPAPIDPAIVAKVMPSAAIQYAGTWFDDLGDDEAIVVTATPPAARYWSVQLLSRWMESGDWANHRVFLTDRDAKVDEDGKVRIVVAHRDPGTSNWLATTGMACGNVAMRALCADGLMDAQFERTILPAPPASAKRQ